jgi:two-component system nitrogen regulation sensor histidine kinase NtrY
MVRPGGRGALRRLFLEAPEGPPMSISAHRTTLKGEGGEPLGWLITFDDTSDLERAQRQEAWREVARRIAHEIKNPLTPISLAAQRLQRRFSERLKGQEDAPVFEECASVIIRQVESMRKLVDEFSQFARLPQADPKPSDIVQAAQESLALFREAHGGISFSLKVEKRPPVFPFDRAQLGRAVSNLLSNAASAVKGSGEVEVEVSLDDDFCAVITVSDDGEGIPPGMKDKIFEPYVTTGGGQGLGLSIVKAIASDHGGSIAAFPRKPKGTSFRLSIPMKGASGDSPSEAKK